MISITEAQADESAEQAIEYFGQASTMYSQMSHMAPWLPSYEELDKKAASLMAAGHAARLTYTTWRDQQRQELDLLARIGKALDDTDMMDEAAANEAGK